MRHVRGFIDAVKRGIARAKAIHTARERGRTLVADGYRFGAVRGGLFTIYRPGEESPTYTVQMYRDRGTGKATYVCSCKSCEVWGICKHGDGLARYLREAIPLVRCGWAAPEPGAASATGRCAFHQLNNFAVARNDTTRDGGSLGRGGARW